MKVGRMLESTYLVSPDNREGSQFSTARAKIGHSRCKSYLWEKWLAWIARCKTHLCEKAAEYVPSQFMLLNNSDILIARSCDAAPQLDTATVNSWAIDLRDRRQRDGNLPISHKSIVV